MTGYTRINRASARVPTQREGITDLKVEPSEKVRGRDSKVQLGMSRPEGAKDLYFALIRTPAFAVGITISAGSACPLNWRTGRCENAWHAAVSSQSVGSNVSVGAKSFLGEMRRQ
jgi:hypothetical protein